MTLMTPDTGVRQLSLPEELILMLLNEESGYFRQVPGWNLNCAVVGAVLAELSLVGRIDTDLDSLILLDVTSTGDPILDPILQEIADEVEPHNAQYWVERLAVQAESIIDLSLERLVSLGILQHHDGDYWSLTRSAWQSEQAADPLNGTAAEFVRSRIDKVIFDDEIPDPRDVVIIALANTCDVLRFIFQLDEESEARVELVCKMDLIGQSISEAVTQTFAVPLLQRPSLTRKIPTVPLRRLVFHRHLRDGNLPAMLADLGETYGPVFQIRPPFQQPMIFLAGPDTNHWAHRYGRLYLSANQYLQDFEKVYGAHGILPALDGGDHYRFRKAMTPAYSRGRLEVQLGALYAHARQHMASWNVGDSMQAASMCRQLINAELSPIAAGVDSQDIIGDLIEYKERALATHVVKVLPKFLLNTPRMKSKAKAVDQLISRVQSAHTPAQRAGCPRDLVDDLLSLHSNDPQFLPESNLKFALSAPLIASVYLGDALSFGVYAMATHPEIYERIRNEADALFDHGDPQSGDLTDEAMDVTRRFIKEVMRVYSIVPVSMRSVINTCVVEGYELPVGSRVYIAQTAAHYMKDVFPDPYSFDIDRYLPSRKEDLGPGYAPFGLGTHTCLGSRWMELHMAVNLLLLAHHYDIEVSPKSDKLKIDAFPSLSLNKKLKFRVSGRRRELPV